jgi:hypothetical protein
MPDTTLRRLNAKVCKTGDCWVWTGSLSNKGYGQMHVSGKNLLAHRVSFELFHGPIPPGMWVLHRCDNRRCVNPDHLFLGDCALNMQDCAAKGRLHFQKASGRGEEHTQAKLTVEQVADMRELYRSGRFTKKDLAVRFGISPSQAGNILLYRHWKHEAAA